MRGRRKTRRRVHNVFFTFSKNIWVAHRIYVSLWGCQMLSLDHWFVDKYDKITQCFEYLWNKSNFKVFFRIKLINQRLFYTCQKLSIYTFANPVIDTFDKSNNTMNILKPLIKVNKKRLFWRRSFKITGKIIDNFFKSIAVTIL